jgi:cobalt/nickel transport system permease protein
MDKLNQALRIINQIDSQVSSTATINPIAKVLVTISFLLTVMFTSQYDLTGLILLTIFPLLILQQTQLHLRDVILIASPVLVLVLMIGLGNPFIDQLPWINIGYVVLNRGVLTWLSMMVKSFCAVLGGYLLIATTSVEAIGYALIKLKIPALIVDQILMTYRYLKVMLTEALKVSQAYALRSVKQNGISWQAWGSLIGPLLLRSIDHAQRVHHSMLLRGYSGVIEHYQSYVWQKTDTGYLLKSLLLIALLKSTGLLI